MIACAGSDAKVKWLKEDLKVDHVFNYKTQDLSETLREVAPDGVDVFFDNVSTLRVCSYWTLIDSVSVTDAKKWVEYLFLAMSTVTKS